MRVNQAIQEVMAENKTDVQKYRNGQKGLLSRFYQKVLDKLDEADKVNGDQIVQELEKELRTPGGYVRGKKPPHSGAV